MVYYFSAALFYTKHIIADSSSACQLKLYAYE